MRFTALALFLFATVSPVHAEYRAALLIQHESGSDVGPVKAALERCGFHCRVATELKGDRSIRNLVESFAVNTPTRGTALVYYTGNIVTLQSREGDRKTIGLPHNGARPGQGQSLNECFSKLKERGGSIVDLFFIDSKEDPDLEDLDLPENTAVAVGSADALVSQLRGNGDLLANLKSAGRTTFANLPPNLELEGAGSKPVAPPDQFPTRGKPGDEWVNAHGLVFCWIPAGKFTMGSPEDTPGRYPDEEQHSVTIKDGFWMQKYELIRGHFITLGKNLPREMVGEHKLHPLNKYHMDDGKQIGRNLTSREQEAGRLPAGWEYSQPSEEQWEYAARAGTQTRYFFGDDMAQLVRYANFADQSYYDTGDIYSNSAHRTLDDGSPGPSFVGNYLPNPWGLHDIYGNVSEWCENGKARGGSRISIPENCRSAYRDSYSPRSDQNYLGYRLVIRKAMEKVRK